MTFDVIIIGSGFGGAVTACRLQEKGYRVLVLERGRRWDKTNFPRAPSDPWIWDANCPERCNGWLDLRRFPNMAIATGAAVGGGSQIYANISCEAPPGTFRRGWPAEITYEVLKPHYDTVKAFMNVREIPDSQWTTKMKLMKTAADRAGYEGKFRKLELAVAFDEDWTYDQYAAGAAASRTHINAQGAEQGTCVHLGNCDIGCDVHAKNTLDRNYLFWAEKKGADVRPLHLVTAIEPCAGGYTVAFDQLKDGTRIPGKARARLVIVAAGSVGSTELLLRCKEAKTLPNVGPFLGRNWSSNGDFLTPALHTDAAVYPTHGPTIGAAIDLYEEGKEGGFWVEDGGFPNLLAGLADALQDDTRIGFKAKLLIDFLQSSLRRHGEFAHVMPWFAQGVDAAGGTFKLRRRSGTEPPELHLEWDVERSRQVIDSIVDAHKKLAEASGGLPLVPPSWTLFRDLITPHPLGGCNMGRSPEDGVVNYKGEVFGYPGLYVADGAIIPEALGVNPSRTIAALAEHIAAQIVAEGK